MAHFFSEASRTFSEYLLLPNLTTKDCIPENVILRTPLVIVLRLWAPTATSGSEYPVCFSHHASRFGPEFGDCTRKTRWDYPLSMGPKVLKSRQQWSERLKITKRVLSSATQI